MERRVVSGMMLILLLVGMLTSAFIIQPSKAEPTTIIVPDDYPTIQQAADAASSGDTVYVRAGTYYETVWVDKSLSLVGEDRGTTVIDGSSGRVRTVSAVNVDHFSVTGFTVRSRVSYPFIGIALGGHNCSASGNNVENCYYGIYLGSYGDDVIMGNDVTNSRFGVYLSYSHNNDVAGNTVTNNYYGIYASGSDRNGIVENNIAANNVSGIDLRDGCDMNILSRNILTNNWISIRIDSSYQNFDNYNRVVENKISNSEIGIDISYSKYNTVVGNKITSNNNLGVALYGSSDNSIVGNNITYNQKGIFSAFGSRGNRIYHNNFIYNTNQVDDDDDVWTNVWDDGYPSGGNYWSDYSGTDADHDGIGDIPYNVSVGEWDNYPLIDPTNIVYPWGDDDNDGILNYLDVPGLSISASVASGQILGFEWSITYSKIDPESDVQSMLSEFRDWGAIDIEPPKHIWSFVLDLDGVSEAMARLRTQASYVISQSFADWMNRLLCFDGNLRYLIVAHSDLEISDVVVFLNRLAKLFLTPDSVEAWFDSFVDAVRMFDFEWYRLYGIDSVSTDLIFDWTGFSSFVTDVSLLIDAAKIADVLNQVITILILALSPASIPILVEKLLVKSLMFALNFMAWRQMIEEDASFNWVKATLVLADPPGEKVVMQLFDPISQELLLGYNSTSGQDIGAFPSGLYLSDGDSALMILARGSADYNLTVTRNVPGSPIPYVLNVCDCVENQTTAVGGFLESDQTVSTNLKVENGILKMSHLLIDANFSSLTPPSNDQVWLNISVTDDVGQPIDNVDVTVCVNDHTILAQNIGGGAYQASFSTAGMLGFYNATVYVANPPTDYLPGVSSYPLMVGTSDISVISSTALKGVVGIGYSAEVNLTFKNNGDTVQPFAVALYANDTLISRQVLSGLPSGASTIIPFVLYTSSLSKGNYTISAYATPILGETDIDDNTYTCGAVLVTIAGDVNGDRTVNVIDLTIVSLAYGTFKGEPNYNPVADINEDGIVEMRDVVIVARNLGKTDP